MTSLLLGLRARHASRPSGPRRTRARVLGWAAGLVCAALPIVGLAANSTGAGSAAPAEIVDAGPVGRTVERLYGPLAKSGGPGAIVAVMRRGELVHLKGYGYANREFKAPWTPDTLYTFYSTAKPMVAVGLMRLADEGRVDLDAPVSRYLPDFPRYPVEPTVRQMLQHTSGVWQDERLHYLVGAGAAYNEISMDELYAMVIRQPELSFRPGSAQHYNDSAMRIAGRVLTTVLGTSFDSAMRCMVLEPAGMTTAVHRPLSNTYRPGQANAYLLDATPEANVARDELWVPFLAVETAGDGGLLGTLRDFLAFARFAAAPRPGGSYVERLAQPVTYGPGVAGQYRTSWTVAMHRGVEVQSHRGLFGKRLVYVPELDAWIVIMANALGGPLDPDASGGGSVFAIVDALLESAGGYGDRFGAAAEAKLGAFGRPPVHTYAAAERKALVGTFVDPVSRGVLRIVADGPYLRHAWLSGESGYLVRDGRGFQSWTYGDGERLRLRVTGGRVEAHLADWDGFRSLERIAEGYAPAAAEITELAGTYYSHTYGAIYHVDVHEGRATLRVGAGARASDRYALTPLAPGVYEAVQQGESRVFGATVFQVAVDRRDGGIAGLTIDAENLRGFRLERVSIRSN
jgi:CubicO group peptidase (beta-lactamase class C family)